MNRWFEKKGYNAVITIIDLSSWNWLGNIYKC